MKKSQKLFSMMMMAIIINPKQPRRRRIKQRMDCENTCEYFNVNNNFMNKSLKFFSIITFIGLIFINIVSSSSSSMAIETNFPCSSFKMNYSFDFAFNQIITANHINTNNNRLYNHYIYSQKKIFQLYFDRSDRLQVKSIEFQQQQQQRSKNNNDDDYYYLQNFSGDYGFSLHMAEPMTSKICSGRIHQHFLTCLDLVYRNISNAYIKNKETFLFEMDDNFRPSLAFQHISYDRYDYSRYMIIFVEQNLQILSINNQSDKIIYQRHFNRRWQVYLFANMERITNQTYNAIVPDYLNKIPTEFELTGVYGWTRKNSDYDEYMIIVFNGTDHLYCMNEACSQSKNYQQFLPECRAPESLIALNQQSLNPKFSQQGLVVTKCCGQWEKFSKNQPNNNNDDDYDDESQWQIRDGKLYRVRSARSTNLNYVIWSLIILGFLILLLLICWIYSCINETRYNDRMIMEKILPKQNDQQQQQQHLNLNDGHATNTIKKSSETLTTTTTTVDNHSKPKEDFKD